MINEGIKYAKTAAKHAVSKPLPKMKKAMQPTPTPKRTFPANIRNQTPPIMAKNLPVPSDVLSFFIH